MHPTLCLPTPARTGALQGEMEYLYIYKSEKCVETKLKTGDLQ